MASTKQMQARAKAARQALKPVAPKTVLILYPNGSRKEVQGDLCNDFRFFDKLKNDHNIDLFEAVPGFEGRVLCDEEGLLTGQEFNGIASMVFGMKLVGPIFIQVSPLTKSVLAKIAQHRVL